MSNHAFPQCAFCKHYFWPENLMNRPKCVVFPEGIPDDIIENRYDHREPYEEDNGTRFEEADDETMKIRIPRFSQKTMQYEKERTIFVMNLVAPHY